MSQYSESYAPRTGEFTAEPSATDVVRDQAADVAQHARQAGSQVTQTAADQTRQVAAETSRQARDLLGEAQGQARQQASAQQQKAARQLHLVADELGQMADKGGQSGLATDAARQAADRLHGAAAWLDKREPADLLAEARSFARRRPGVFLIGAAIAGLAAGRLTRGLAAGDNEQPNTAGRPAARVSAVNPAEPVYPAAPVYPGEPVYPTDPTYPAEPVYPAAPGWGPNSEGPR
jgi:hypothetical protein